MIMRGLSTFIPQDIEAIKRRQAERMHDVKPRPYAPKTPGPPRGVDAKFAELLGQQILAGFRAAFRSLP
jgi:hypothetical protein